MSPSHDARRPPPDFVQRLFDIKDRAAVVTGGGSGLGAAIAEGFAQAGAAVALLDVDDERMDVVAKNIESDGGDVICVHADVTVHEEVSAAADAVLERYGRVDILLNSAGSAFRSPAEDFPEDKYDFILALNLKGTYLCCQVFGRTMLVQQQGSIINMASIGSFAAYPLASAYQASKGGVKQLTRALALEWRTRGVRVNALAPTLMESPLTQAAGKTTSVTSDFIKARMLRPRLGLPQELIGSAIFLASDASELVTGHTLTCDDGYTIA